MKNLLRFVFAALAALAGFGATAGEWTTGTWTSATAAENNLARGTGVEISQSGNGGQISSLTTEACLALSVNGIFERTTAGGNIYGLSDNAVWTVMFNNTANVSGFNIYTYWSDSGRNGMGFTGIEVTTDGTTWTALDGSAMAKWDPSDGGGLYAKFANSDGSNLATGVTGLRLVCASMDNKGTGVSEIEVIGEFTGSAKVFEVIATGEAWSGTISTVDDINAFAMDGAVCNLDQGTRSGYMVDYTDKTVLTDGVIADGGNPATTEAVEIGNGATLEYILPCARDLAELRFYSRWGDGGRDAISVKTIEVKTAENDEYTALDFAAFNYDGNNKVLLKVIPNPESENAKSVIANDVTAVKITFGAMDNNGTAMIEVQGLVSKKSGYAVWSDESWTSADRSAVKNLLRRDGASVKVISNPNATERTTESGLAAMTDGKCVQNYNKPDTELYCIGSSAVIEYDFDRSTNLSGLDFWTYWDAGRDGQSIKEILVRKNGADIFLPLDTVLRYATHTLAVDGGNTSAGAYHYMLRPTTDGAFLAEKIDAVRIVFGIQDNAYTGYLELEAFGRSAEGLAIIVR